eukprot:scaffold978_cov172-Ochromonas_danica.AAC.16
MGCCCARDVIPNAPDVIKEDPNPQNPITVQVAALGSWGSSRDYGIWENARPKTGDEASKTVWMWFNKSNITQTQVRIDLENFKRGHIPDQPKKGKILYYATMSEKPSFQSFQRVAGSGMDGFFGFFGQNTYQDREDNHYINHPQHTQKWLRQHPINGHIVSKWSMSGQAYIYDGDLGRGEAGGLHGQPLLLEIFSKGTVVTTYQEWQERVEDRDAEGKVTGHRMVEHHAKHTTELVDRVEYRLTHEGMMWCQWYCEGDSFSTQGDPSIDSPLFVTTIGGGWFTRSYFSTSTRPGVDPALAILISHVCATEYSVAQIKSDLQIATPNRFPHQTRGYLGNGIGGMSLFYAGVPTKGNFNFRI